MNINELRKQNCKPLKGKEHALDVDETHQLLGELSGWKFGDGEGDIGKAFKFADFLNALAFVNAVGWIAEQQNHHPDIELGWGTCTVRFSTHDVGGLSINDFISAAKVDSLVSK
ncbi:MAG: 4a-hydroxytetrahydrobiopterin dehydratase [Rudaea sp.]